MTATVLDMETEPVIDIIAAMKGKGLITDTEVCKWAKRQPIREDETASERKEKWKAQRAEKAKVERNGTQRERNGTQRNAFGTLGTCIDSDLDSDTDLDSEKALTTSAPSDKPLAAVRDEKLSFDFSSGKFVNVNGQLSRWQETFPAVNISAEILKAGSWLMANPKNKKSNYERFLHNWLTKAQDHAGRSSPASKSFVKQREEESESSLRNFEKAMEDGHGVSAFFGRHRSNPGSNGGNSQRETPIGILGDIAKRH
jgi:hypothetical protein